MRLMLSYIMLTVYLVYLLIATFPALAFYISHSIIESNKTSQLILLHESADFSDFNYLNAIKERAGMNDIPDNGTPQKVSNENIVITCIIKEKDNLDPALGYSETKKFLYLNLYIDNFPEVAVPPPKSV